MEFLLPTPDIRNILCAFLGLTIPATAYSAKPVPEPPPGEIRDCMTISESRVYSVTQDLPGTQGLSISGDCITLEASNITINLNGYTIRGGGTGAGISDGGAELENVRVRGGTISGFAHGVSLANSSDSMVENVTASNNIQDGISLGVRGVARLNVASLNDRGLVLQCPANIVGNSAWDNATADLFQIEPQLCVTGDGLNSFGSSGGSGGSCPTYLTECSGTCRDLETDEANCGACGNACSAGELCTSGTCTISCGTGLIECSGICRDLLSDEANCGTCGTYCNSGERCVNGSCTLDCPDSTVAIGEGCVDPQFDPRYCGASPTFPGQDCTTTGRYCVYGACQCPGGLSYCGAGCVDLSTNESYCGDCYTQCGTGEFCSAGSCITP